jgi:hypothetical protein
MTTLVFLLEEPSARDVLEGLLPRLIPDDVVVCYMVFEGKQDLEKRMVSRMRSWLQPDTRFVVLRDQDAADCHDVKARLRELVEQAGRPDALVRVACRELESWIVGDWPAVAVAFCQTTLSRQSQKAKFRNPDALGSPVEEIRRFIPDYQKRDGARRMGKLLAPERNQSKSFQVFCSGVQRLVGGEK